MTDRPRVLVGIDGSEDGIRAARYGIGRALASGADLWFANAVDDGVSTGGWGVIYDPAVLKEAGDAAVAQASELAVAKGVPADRIRTDVVIGSPASVLSEFSRQAEILIVGRRASTGLERMFVGSTSTSLVSVSYCPLIVISAASTPEATGKFQKITVALGHSGDTALRWACKEAQSRGFQVDVLHVFPNQLRVGLVQATAQQEKEWLERVQAGLEEIVGPVRADFPELSITLRSPRGVLADELIQESAHVDLLVLGIRPRATGMVPGPVRGVLAHSSCPVALITR